MSDLLQPSNTVTFTIKRIPRSSAKHKTIVRLMQMQPEVRRGLANLQRRRRQVDNHTYIRAGKAWTDRKRATKLAWVEPGETFTLKLTAQILPDVRSIADYVEMSAA